MKNTFADITIILDRSGSMASVTDETIEGFNRFLTQQQQLGESAVISLIQFNDQIEKSFTSVLIKDAGRLNREHYRPSGGTALLDAIGITIAETAKRVRSRLTASGTDN